MIQIIGKDEGFFLVRDTAQIDKSATYIKAYSPWSVLIPFESHQITFIEEAIYESPEVSSLENISVEVDFIVRDEHEEVVLYEDELHESTRESDSANTGKREITESGFKLDSDLEKLFNDPNF